MDAIELFGAEQVERSRLYHRPLYTAALGGLSLQIAILASIAFGRPGGWLFEPLERSQWWAQVAGFAALIEAITALVVLPIAFWAGFVRERRWGFSTQNLGGYAGDRTKAFALGLALSIAALLGLMGSARLFPNSWPLVSFAGGALLVVALGFLAPLLVEPLFNRFTKLDDPELGAELRGLAERARLPIKELLVADASRRTRKANAYVSGLGRTRRLVLYDTLLAGSSKPEIGLVLAHELGHRHGRHLVKGTLLGVIGCGAFILVLWSALRWPDLRSAIHAPGGARDPRVAPFVLLLGAALQTLVSPFGAALSRRWEREADRFSLELAGELADFESTHRLLATANLSDLDPPRPIYLAFFSHPTAVERINAARSQAASARLVAP